MHCHQEGRRVRSRCRKQTLRCLIMKLIPVLAVAAVLTSLPLLRAADAKSAKAKPYTLDYCLVSDEKFEGSGMTPYETVVDGQTIKFCCKSCLKDFNKETKKYLKKLADAEKKTEKK